MPVKDFLAMIPDISTPSLTSDGSASLPSDIDDADDAALHDYLCPRDEQPWAWNEPEDWACIGQESGHYDVDPNSFDAWTNNLHHSTENLDECLKNIATAQKTVQDVLHGSIAVEQPEVVYTVFQGVAASAKAKPSSETACKTIDEAFPDFDDKQVELSDINSEDESLHTAVSSTIEDSSEDPNLDNRLLSNNSYETLVAFEGSSGNDHKMRMSNDTACECNLICYHHVKSLGFKANIQPADNTLITSLSGDEVEYVGTVVLKWSLLNAAVRKPITSKFFVVPNNNYAITMPILGTHDIRSNGILVFNPNVFQGSVYTPAYHYTASPREGRQPPEATSNRASHQRTVDDFDSLTKARQAEKKKKKKKDLVFPLS